MTGSIAASDDNKQILDSLAVERERGITVKAKTLSMLHADDRPASGHASLAEPNYLLNLIDTPGHVDFGHEVNRAIAACQGALLLVDASHGIQAQTIANYFAAIDRNLSVIPVINKIDLKSAKVDAVLKELSSQFGLASDDIIQISAKFGTNVEKLFDAIIDRIPPPPPEPTSEELSKLCGDVTDTRALMFDSWFTPMRGVTGVVNIAHGALAVGDSVCFLQTQKHYTIRELGLLTQGGELPLDRLRAGQVGYVVCGIRKADDVFVGDTLFKMPAKTTVAGVRELFGKDGKTKCAVQPLLSFKQPKPMVYAGMFPINQEVKDEFETAVRKLVLNDPSVEIEKEDNPALGAGFRAGFLGLLHMDVFTERLRTEFLAEVIATSPSVPYRVRLKGERAIKTFGEGHEWITIHNPEKLPASQFVSEYEEPWVVGTIVSPARFMQDIVSLCIDRRGQQKSLDFLTDERVKLDYFLPLNEIIVDFFHTLKSQTSGFASFNYDNAFYKPASLTKVEFFLNDKPVSELSVICTNEQARPLAFRVCERLRDELPQQLFAVKIQGACSGKIIAREDIRASGKKFTKKSGVGSLGTRVNKLIAQQKEGKARMRLIGKVEVPHDVMVKVLRREAA